MQHDDRPQLVSIGTAARVLGVSQSILRKWEDNGLIAPPARIGGDGRRCYRPDEIEALRTFAATRPSRRRQPATAPVGA